MFHLFSRTKRFVGIEFGEHVVRFVELSRGNRFDEIISYGEMTDKENFFTGETLLKCCANIKKVVKTKEAIVSLPEGRFTPKTIELLKKSGLNFKVKSVGEALVASSVPEGSEHPFLVAHLGEEKTTFALVHKRKKEFFESGTSKTSILSTLNHIYTDWYKDHKEKITYVLLSGKDVAHHEVLDYLRQGTRIHILRANTFANLRLNSRNLPILTKDESLAYSIPLGLLLL
jgi:Tfp pilus assembly PilM family ATPase